MPQTYTQSRSAQFKPGGTPLAVYDDETLVGFIMYELDVMNQIEKAYFICRLMIDSAYQGRGYGRIAMQQVISRLKEYFDCQVIETSYVPENIVAAKLYHSLGFVPTGKVEEGEIVVQLVIKNYGALLVKKLFGCQERLFVCCL